jgi:hypothetical protein
VGVPWSRRQQAGADDVEAWARHRAKAGALVDELFDESVGRDSFRLLQPPQGPDSLGAQWRERLAAEPPDVVGSAVMLLIQASVADHGLNWGISRTVSPLSRARWTVDREDALLAGRTATLCGGGWTVAWALRAAVTALERTCAAAPLSDAELKVARDLLTNIERRTHLDRNDRVALRSRLLKLLPQASDDVLDTSSIAPVDGWSAVVLPELGTRPETALVNRLVRHLAAGRGSKPTVKWRAANKGLVTDGAVIEMLQMLCEGLLSADPVQRKEWHVSVFGVVLDAANSDIARAALWALADVDRPWVLPLLQKVTAVGMYESLIGGWGGDKLPNACIVTLGLIASPAAIMALQQMLAGTKHAGFRKRMNAALTLAAESVGLTSGELVERTIDPGGLDHERHLTLTSGAVTATVQLQDDLTLDVAWHTASGTATKPPAAAEKRDLSAVKKAVKELKGLVGADRRRLEALLGADRTWELTDWQHYYLEHPITGVITRRLIWTITNDTRTVTGIPNADATLLQTPNGDEAIPPVGTVTLWHPALATTDTVHAWRYWLVDQHLVQPFKQAYREVYLLTPAERQTSTYSNRFAAHILGYQQLYSLTKERQWVANYLGRHDGGYDGRARKEFANAKLTAVFEHFPADDIADRVQLASTDRVWFHRTNDRSKQAVALDEVPPLVFSEAMRDVDLFVSVTSIALDPNWADRGEDPHYAYWQQVSFGELSAVADVRRDVLTRLLPKLKVADRVELLDRYVRVRGTRATYKIHIGSANIMVEPDDRYLCIVPTSTGAANRIMLPFEGDNVLSVILTKIVMLAADDQITDPTINRQIDART